MTIYRIFKNQQGLYGFAITEDDQATLASLFCSSLRVTLRFKHTEFDYVLPNNNISHWYNDCELIYESTSLPTPHSHPELFL